MRDKTTNFHPKTTNNCTSTATPSTKQQASAHKQPWRWPEQEEHLARVARDVKLLLGYHRAQSEMRQPKEWPHNRAHPAAWLSKGTLAPRKWYDKRVARSCSPSRMPPLPPELVGAPLELSPPSEEPFSWAEHGYCLAGTCQSPATPLHHGIAPILP